MELVRRYEVEAVYSFGSMFDGVPHTRPPRVSMAVAQGGLQRSLAHLGLELISYEGPSSVHTALLQACKGRRTPAASFWGHVPAYAQLGWNPRVTLALLETVVRLLKLNLNLQELRDRAEQVDELLNRLVQSDADLQQQVYSYERQYDEQAQPESFPNAESIVSEVEEFLRGSHEDGE
jgi:proteasome assembly chaperone (PAC2) family protein